MKNTLLSLLMMAGLSVAPMSVFAADVVNITPRPTTMSVKSGSVALPTTFTIGGTAMSDALKADVEHFVKAFNANATGYTALMAETTDDAFVRLNLNTSLSAATYGTEGYKLVISADGIDISAPTDTGLYYGLISLKKLMPANVTIGVPATEVLSGTTLPLVTITDSPRFRHRGFMLDCSRHFFTVEELKRMLDIMAVYKMNKFHWHLTDDQGWRAEIKKYPKLTTVAATTVNSWMVDRLEGGYWTNEQYGPYFYSQDDMRDIVAYAAERHIDIIPEIEFPGHALACMAAYPEYSCNPSGSHGGLMPYGVSRDVLNVGDPKAMQFVYDILSEIMDIFPGELIHIGGDECPANAWNDNAQCQQKMKDLGLTHIRQLQSHFNKDVANFIGQRGRRLATWNESLDCEGADQNLMASTGATIWCWTNAWGNATNASKLGLDAVLTPWTRGYINRAQSKDEVETYLPGDGSDNVPNVYGIDPMPSNLTTAEQKHIAGVQGTFWTENIGTPDMLEYMAMPRLMCIAEVGWTSKTRKDFADFQERMRLDTEMLDLGGYHYARHYIDEETSTTADFASSITVSDDETLTEYYIVNARNTAFAVQTPTTKPTSTAPVQLPSGNDASKRAVFVVKSSTKTGANTIYIKLSDGKYYPVGVTGTTSSADSKVSVYLTKATNGDWKIAKKEGTSFTISPSAATSVSWNMHGGNGKPMALYDKNDGGSTWAFMPLPVATASTMLADYVKEAKAIVASEYVTADPTPAFGLYSAASIAALKAIMDEAEGVTDDDAAAAINPRMEAAILDAKKSMARLEQGKSYRFRNVVERFEGSYIYYNGKGSYLLHGTDADAHNEWIATIVEDNADGSQTVKLKNTQHSRFFGKNSTQQGRAMWPVGAETTGQKVTITFHPEYGDYTLTIGGKDLVPIGAGAEKLEGTVTSGNTGIDANNVLPARHVQGSGWMIEAVEDPTAVSAPTISKNAGEEAAIHYDLNGRVASNTYTGIVTSEGRKRLRM